MLALVEHQLGFGGEGEALEIVPAGHVMQPVPIEGIRFTQGGEPGLQGTKLVLANVIDRAQRTDHHAGRDQPNSYETHSRHSPLSHSWVATWIYAAISSARRRRGASLSGPGYRRCGGRWASVSGRRLGCRHPGAASPLVAEVPHWHKRIIDRRLSPNLAEIAALFPQTGAQVQADRSGARFRRRGSRRRSGRPSVRPGF